MGIDENTAMVGDGATWPVAGRQGVHVLVYRRWGDLARGDVFDLGLRRRRRWHPG